MDFVRAILLTSGLAVLGGCAELFSYGDEAERADARREAESAKLWEMTIAAGRYGAMLGQAREILKLPEPARRTDAFPSEQSDEAKAREALARYQVSVTQEFLADTVTACKRNRVPRALRKLACEQHAKVPSELTAPVGTDIKQLSVRNDRVGEVIMPWWDAVCATAPKPREGEPGACAME